VSRRRAARVLLALAAVVVGLALVADHARRTLFDADSFAGHAAAVLQDDDVRALVAQRVTDQVVLKREGDLLAARPVIEGVVSGLVGSAPFRRLFEVAVRDAHRAVFERDANTLTLTLADVGTVAAQALRVVRPKLADKLERRDAVLLERRLGSATAGLARAADRVRRLALILTLLAVALAAAGIAVARDRREAIGRLAVGVAVAGAVVAVAAVLARGIVVGRIEDPEARAAAGAVWRELAGGLVRAGWLVALGGAIVAAAARSLLRPVDLGGAVDRARGLLREPAGTPARVARAVALIAAGVLVVLEPAAVVRALTILAGVALAFTGVDALLRIIYRPHAAAAPEEEGPPRKRRARLAAALAAAVVLLAAVGVLLGASRDETRAAAPRTGACNGHAELCGRTLPEVALLATHNSMSVPLPGWFSAEQDHPIARQLEDGVRGLLIDTYDGDQLGRRRVRTVIGKDSKLPVDAVSPQARAAALRLRARLGFRGKGTRHAFLCHTFCELGFTRLSAALEDVQAFLVNHPDDVLVVVNQDAIAPAEFVGAVKQAGLGTFVMTPPEGGDDWPTLREMIDTGRRLLIVAENREGSAPWYRLGYRGILQDTPYEFRRRRLLTHPADRARSCRPFRGGTAAPLFLMNHWISTDPVPRPSDARRVNARRPLLARAEACRRLRHRLPNLVAVNFYARGNGLAVVDALNGVR
jgi:hypothetical protein